MFMLEPVDGQKVERREQNDEGKMMDDPGMGIFGRSDGGRVRQVFRLAEL
jgi:hypothetical protein